MSRRSLARGVAWAAPTAVLAVAAPAVAASPPANCPEMPTGAAWTVSHTGSYDAAPATWTGDTLQMETNNTSTSSPTRVDFTTSIPVASGIEYTIGFEVQTRAGYGATECSTSPTQFNVFLDTGTGFTRVIYSTSTENPAIISVIPPSNCTEPGPGTAEWGADSTVGATQTVTFSFTSDQDGTVDLRMRFFLTPLTGGLNDDWRVTPFFVSCVLPP